MNARVEKSTPEEAAVIQNMASLIQQLQAMGVGDQSFQQPGDPSQGPSGAPGQGGQPVQGAAFKSGEGAEGNGGAQAFDRTEDPQNDTSPEGPTARRPQMKTDNGGQRGPVLKAKQTDQAEDNAETMDGDISDTSEDEGYDADGMRSKGVTKAIIETENDGTQSLDAANDIIFSDLPESTKENVKDIRKALRSIGLDVAPMKRPVRKSIGGGSDEIAQLRAQVGFLANTISEMVEGFGVAKSVQFEDPAAPRSVQKSRPVGSYSGQEDIASVLKSLVTEIRNERTIENEESNPWHSPEVVKKSMRQFTENMSGIAGGLWPKN